MDNDENEREKGAPASFGVVIARTVTSMERPLAALGLTLEMGKRGRDTGLFLVGDGIYMAKRGVPEISDMIERLVRNGTEVVMSPEHLKASGLGTDQLVSGVTLAKRTYRDLVGFVMERYEKVIVC